MIEELNELLAASEEDYYKFDYFENVQEIATNLKNDEWKEIISSWNSKTHEWKTRFTDCLYYVDKEYIKELISKILLDKDNEELVLSLMTKLPNNAQNDRLYSDLLGFSKKYWDENPDKRSMLKMCTWSCGLSKRLLNELGYNSWKEAGV